MTDRPNFIYEAPFGVHVIRKILPHRYPFLLVDGITELGTDYIRGFKNLSVNEELLQGHFPDEPIYPGVLHVESLAQMGACWILAQEQNVGKTAYLMSVESAKFRRPIVPGDRLDMLGKITNLKSRTGRLVGEIRVNDQLVSEAVVLFAFQKSEPR